MDFDDDILDIEGFDFSVGLSPYPMKAFVPRVSSNTLSYVFIAPRTNDLIDRKGGMQITYFTAPNAAFSTILACG